MKKVIVSIILFLTYVGVKGQISTNEAPVSFKTNLPALKINDNSFKLLPSLDMLTIEKEDEENKAFGSFTRFGFRHEVSYNLANSGEWIELPNGDRIWRLSLCCPEALSINLLYDEFWLPDGAKFFIYSNDLKHCIGAFTSINNKGTRNNMQGFATGLVYGDQVNLEYYLPNNVQETGIISIAYVVHGYRYIALPESINGRNYVDPTECQVNVNCSPEGDEWQLEKNAVVLILADGYGMCTGSLINNTENDFTPYILTANHCIKKHDAINNPNLTHWLFYWHYEAPGCISTFNPSHISTSGATVISNNSILDFVYFYLTKTHLMLREQSHIILVGIVPAMQEPEE